jgi:hypothetical protein
MGARIKRVLSGDANLFHRPPFGAVECRDDQDNDHVTRKMAAAEVKAKILVLLDEVAAGGEIEITKAGRTPWRASCRLLGRARSRADLPGSL